ncbi:hypothetical protein M8C21_012059 [Ambrosia artemisiifolia]|uniref:ABC transporter domain-containing protein n=1 Tax=Ambrosia artemisiifolia TaxID=4212 RepID=A0AAD5GIA0_AMBAR|nr:hypothetical protein M8C21_012059 [Ambrosia artemisiifolia]
MTVSRLPIFYKQRDMYFYPAWAYAIPASILKIPLSLLESTIWTCLTYYVIGYSPEPGSSVSMFRFLASIFQTVVASTTAGSISILFLLTFGGFIIPHSSMPAWIKWVFWFCPMSYGEIGLVVNEFLSPRWNKMTSTNTTIGQQTLQSRGLDFEGYYYWISLGALSGFALLFNIGFVLALGYLKAPGTRAIISKEKISQVDGSEGSKHQTHNNETTKISNTNASEPYEGKMVLPFEPLTITFQDLQYYVEPPPILGLDICADTMFGDAMRRGISGGQKKRLTTGEMIVGPTKALYLDEISNGLDKEILETVELYAIKDSLVGIPGVSGLSTEQRKRLTIAVEVVANPSIIFMDEPTTGLDARSAAIVMRAAKNIVNTGRTIVCTIHQPSIDIFEAFDELILLKNGGRMIYCGPLGHNSSRVIEYFESISGVPKISDNYNPATWMLEVTSPSMEAELGVDFGQIYSTSTLYESNKEHVNALSKPPAGSKDLYFPTRFPQNGWGQFKACLWKQYLSYWRSPSYNLMRSLHMLFASLTLGLLFWNQGRKIHNQQSLFTVLGSMSTAVIFCGINNASSAIPYVSMERTVLYRERFSGMYASWAYALAQVTIEFPYLFTLSLAFLCITYPMIGYYWSAFKVFCYFYTFLCTLMYFTYLGMLLVAVTPSFPVAAILQSAFYTTFNLFSGFLIPRTVSLC